MKRQSLLLMGHLVIFMSMLPLSYAQEAADDDDVRPSPPSIGTDIPVTYFGPPPSSVEPELIGPFQLLTAGALDENAGTITLPLYRGELQENTDNPDAPGQNIWYILTDTTDAAAAQALGLNHAGKLAFAQNGRAVRTAFTQQDGTLMFNAGSVDFSPVRSVVAGTDTPFPPSAFQPGAVGDELYSPLVRITNAGGHTYNAPMVSYDTTPEQLSAFCDNEDDSQADGITAAEEVAARALIHDNVVSICPGEDGEPGTVTMRLVAGFSFAKPVLYLTTDANDPLPAALEGGVYAPGLRDVAVGRDDSFLSAVERLFTFVNGPTNVIDGEVNPQRQGLGSAVLGEGGPLNVLGGIPTVATDYSPLWDLNVGEWTQTAINRGYRARLTEEFQILGFVERGFITAPGGGTYGSSGFIVNCPIVHRFL